jgi:hypothetical protein
VVRHNRLRRPRLLGLFSTDPSTIAEVCLQPAPARAGGEERDVPLLSPCPNCCRIAVRPNFCRRSASFWSETGILPDTSPSIYRILSQPLQSNCLSFALPLLLKALPRAWTQRKELRRRRRVRPKVLRRWFTRPSAPQIAAESAADANPEKPA